MSSRLLTAPPRLALLALFLVAGALVGQLARGSGAGLRSGRVTMPNPHPDWQAGFGEERSRESREWLAAGFPQGMCPITVRLTSRTVPTGFILPRTRLDIARVSQARAGVGDEVVLRGVLVWEVETFCWLPSWGPPPASTAVLAVTPDEARRLNRELRHGAIRLIVRQEK